ncbi:MAG: CPBP family intramembrane metalloprotease [Solobacterium sp.]|nr:CPBP family intramembrane metalloprotease [Solobacterium sp.]
MNKYIRKCGKTSDILPLAYLITFGLLLLGQLVGLPISALAEGQVPWLNIALRYFNFIGIWIIGLLFIYRRDNEPMKAVLMPNDTGNTWKWILIGSGIGLGTNALCAVLSLLFKDIALSFSCFEPIQLIIILLCVAVQSGAEELMTRCYLLEKLARRYKSPYVAIIGNAVLFGLLHFTNDGVNFWGAAQTMIIGVMLSLMVMYYNSFWGAVMVHTLWNYSQNIIFGLPNSGIVSPYSIFHLDAASSGFFFDPGFGIEGSPGACLLLLLCIVLFVLDIRKRNLKPIDLWKQAEEQAEQAAAAEKPAQ